ncbi:MAG: Protease 3 [Chlamydiae bacterium]|nr:Protease 3 [Chlamydiota bacterium]
MKNIFLFSLILLSTTLLGKPYEVVEDLAELTIETPDLAKRKTRKIRLSNNLEALLISDPGTNESGAAMAVEVGSWEDPQDRPGMAHFVEHLLFLGTEKYPDESAYSRYLDEHGGMQNAFTMADRTVYMFSAQNQAFSEALDRFGQFFIAPLFSPSGVNRECNAIHQEFCKNVPLDPWRVLHVKKELSNKSHPFHNFAIGNLDTLANISQDELKAWYQKHYSANLMHLVVYSSQDLDILENQVVEIFSEVPNKESVCESCQEPVLAKETISKLVAITPIQNVQLLELSWELPRFYGKDLDHKIDQLITYVLGHEGENSLLAQLKRENLAESVGAGNFRAGKDQCFMTLSISLTSKGVKEYEKVITRCFEAIASFRQSGVPRYIYDEVVEIETLAYKFQTRDEVFSFVTDLATHMTEEPLETYPRKLLIPEKYDPQKVDELLALMTPETCSFSLVAPPEATKIKPTRKEKWLNVPYTLVPLSDKKIAAWSEAKSHSAITIPRPNPYLPEVPPSAFLPQEKESVLPKPFVVKKEENGTLYISPDTRFGIPEICWTLQLKTPLISDTDPESHVYADLLSLAVHDKLNAAAYEASLAGLAYSLKLRHDGLEITLKGFGEKGLPFLETLLASLKMEAPSKEQFSLYIEQLQRVYANAAEASPLKQGSELLSSILYKNHPTLEEKFQLTHRLSHEKMKRFCARIWEENYVEGMLYGAKDLEEGKAVWAALQKNLKGKAYPSYRHEKIEMATLPDHHHPSYLAIPSAHPANALILTADCGEFTFTRRAAQEILTKGLEEPFYSELRTRQQTAYLVANWSQEMERHLYSFFAIQSSSHDNRDLLARFELFLESSLQHLSDKVIPAERFAAIQNSLVKRLQNPAENPAKMGALLHNLAFSYDGDFAWFDKRIKALEELTYEEFLSYATEFLGKANQKRLAVFVNGLLPQKGRVSYHHLTTPEKIKSEITYRGKEGGEDQLV